MCAVGVCARVTRERERERWPAECEHGVLDTSAPAAARMLAPVPRQLACVRSLRVPLRARGCGIRAHSQVQHDRCSRARETRRFSAPHTARTRRMSARARARARLASARATRDSLQLPALVSPRRALGFTAQIARAHFAPCHVTPQRANGSPPPCRRRRRRAVASISSGVSCSTRHVLSFGIVCAAGYSAENCEPLARRQARERRALTIGRNVSVHILKALSSVSLGRGSWGERGAFG